MKLNTKERVLLLTTLRDIQSDWATLKTKRVLAEELSASEEELAKTIEKKVINGKDCEIYHWDAVKPREFTISETLNKKIKNKLEELDRGEKLTDDWYSLMCKFFPDVEDTPKNK